MASISKIWIANASRTRWVGAGFAGRLATAGVLVAIAGCASLPGFAPTSSAKSPEEVPLRIVARAPAAPLELPMRMPPGGPGSPMRPEARASEEGTSEEGTSEEGTSEEARSEEGRSAGSPGVDAARAEPRRIVERPSAREALLATLDGRIEDHPTPAADNLGGLRRESSVSQVSFASEGGDFAPVLDASAEFVVFASTQHRTTFDLYRKSVQGRAVTLLTDDPADDMMPALSPDGARIAFASNRNGNWDIFTMPADGGAAVQVTSEADDETHPTWAPDGRRLAISRRNARTGNWEIWVVDAENAGVRTFVCEGFQPRWSPDGERDRLLFQRARQRGSRLYSLWTIELVDGEGRHPTEIVSARNAAVVQPAWSPDGTRIAFATVVNPDVKGEWPEESDVWTVAADGSGRTAVTSGSSRNMQPHWGSDGRIYFTSNRSGVENIWAAAVARSPRTGSPMTARAGGAKPTDAAAATKANANASAQANERAEP